MSKKILIVDDEQAIVDILQFNLKKEGYDVVTACDGMEGLELFKNENPDLLLLDIMMPVMDGITLCKEVRKTSSVPIIMLTARAEESDKINGLDVGADDYMTKPFGIRELVARVKANLRRMGMNDTIEAAGGHELLKFEGIVIDTVQYEVNKAGEVIDLTVREYELLKFLASQKHQIFSREQLLEQVWGYEYYGDLRTVDVTVRRLREKIEDEPSNPKFIMTKRGIGYYFKDE